MDDLTSSDEDEPGGSSQDVPGAAMVTMTWMWALTGQTRRQNMRTRASPSARVESRAAVPWAPQLQPSSVVKALFCHASTWHECSHPARGDKPCLHEENVPVVARKGCLVYKTAEDTASLQSVRSASIVGRLAHESTY